MIALFTPALACGGLFCATTPTQPLPVVQNGERIAFAIQDGFVEAHVQVFYEGPPDQFAWVVPVQPDTEVFVSNEALFQQLDLALAPTFVTSFDTVGDCTPIRLGCGSEMMMSDRPPPAVLEPEVPGVTVDSEGQVGPYDFLILSGNSEQALLDYLANEGFDFDASMADALAPYVTEGSAFLAIRLQKDRSTGDIAPIGFRYAADEATIPIQLTRIAATPDMGLQINVFGDAPAVSTNYLHAEIDHAKIDWQNAGSNYYTEVVARAVDEAGGHAVVTDFADETARIADVLRLWDANDERILGLLYDAPDEQAFVDALNTLAPPENGLLDYGFEGFGDPRQPDVTLEPSDLPLLAAQLDERVFSTLRRAQAMFELPVVTRLSTTLDPAEMTLDPRFAINPAAPYVDNTHASTLTRVCRSGDFKYNERELPDGRVYRLRDQTLDEATESYALRILDWDADGEPTVVVDHSELVFDESDNPSKACGCAGQPWDLGALAVLLSAVGLRRRP